MIKSTYSKDNIAKFLSDKFDKEITLKPIVAGQESQVFSFYYDNKDFIIRINPIIDGFLKDDYAYRNFSSIKVPIPKVVEYGSFDSSHSFCISEKATGITFEDADEHTVNALLSDMTELWLSISEIDISNTKGYGIFSSKDGNAPYSSWQEYLKNIFNEQEYDWNKVREMQHVDSELFDDLKATLLSLIKYCPTDRKLSHGDFGSNNVLIDDQTPKITAIIDWDNASYGDPFYDIAGAYFWRNWLMCMEKTSSYWETMFKLIPNYNERIKCYQLHIGLEEIYENALNRDIKTLTWCQQRCRQILTDKT